MTAAAESTTSTIPRYVPWQLDWKRPHYERPTSSSTTTTDSSEYPPLSSSIQGGTTTTTTTVVVSHSAAEVVMLHEKKEDGTQSTSSSAAAAAAAAQLVSVTLLSSSSTSTTTTTTIADTLLLEVITRQPGGELKCIQSKRLYWPGSLMDQDAVDDDDDDNDNNNGGSHATARPWWRPSWMLMPPPPPRRSTKIGMVAATWLNVPVHNNNNNNDVSSSLQDTLHVMNLLSLGLPLSTTHAAPKGTGVAPAAAAAPSSSTTTTPTKQPQQQLVLAIATNVGQLHVYALSDLLLPRARDHDSTEEVSLWWFGSTLLETVHETVGPLSHPMQSLQLSVPLSRTLGRLPPPPTLNEQDEEDDAQQQNVDSLLPDHTATTATATPSVWDSAVWDVTREVSSLPYQTISNRPTLCCQAHEYLCVAGKGRRRRRSMMRPHQRLGMVEHHGLDRSNTAAKVVGGGPAASPVAASSTRASTVASTASHSSEYYDGGFVTFFGLHQWAETRTVFLPFSPRRIQALEWGPMTFCIVLGESHQALAIRIDSNDIFTVTKGQAPSWLYGVETVDAVEHKEIPIHRFQSVPIVLPDTEDLTPYVVASEGSTSPPGLALLFVDEHSGQASVLQRTFQCVDWVSSDDIGWLRGASVDPVPTIRTEHVSSARFQIPADGSLELLENVQPNDSVWCYLGQGWSLIGIARHRYFVCWEGATAAHGAHVQDLGQDEHGADGQAIVTAVVPNCPVGAQSLLAHDHHVPLELPFAGISRKSGALRKNSSLLSDRDDDNSSFDGLDDIVVEALRSISSQSYRDNVVSLSPPRSPRRSTSSYTNIEKSERLLRHCSSWTQLEKSPLDPYEMPTPVLSVRFGAKSSAHSILSLRDVVVKNGAATPFQQVLSWMSENEDYFAAASLALDLLRDAKSLRLLWRAFEKIDDADEREKLEGLLDGILPIGESSETDAVKSTMTHLADMTVGCLTKGGYTMSSTLEHFLETNENYNLSKACLMLVATTARAVSDDPETVASVMGKGYTRDDNNSTTTELLWPLRCLLKAAVARGNIYTALVLLNSSIPDELRHRGRGGLAAAFVPSMELCKSIVSMIVASSDSSAELLLGLVDEHSRSPYWESLQHETQLELSLLEIGNKVPMLRQPEVRLWALNQLDRHLVEGGALGLGSKGVLPSRWLRSLCMACLTNAGCDTNKLRANGEVASPAEADLIQQHGTNIREIRNALEASKGSGGLDFDLLIPSLLILEGRGESWHENAAAKLTQDVLNQACYLAGRRTLEEPFFGCDVATLMRQCTLASNVPAGANVIGGSNGLILECCDILIRECYLTMEDAENLLVAEPMPIGWQYDATKEFSVGSPHVHILWLLREYVLSVRTYGDFDTHNSRHHLDPVLAARLCLRTWWCLTRYQLQSATPWLVKWLSSELEMHGATTSLRRLACAALLRAIMWPKNPSDLVETTLACRLELPPSLLVSLTRSCCGLVESVPSHEIVGDDVRPDASFRHSVNDSINESFVSATSELVEWES